MGSYTGVVRHLDDRTLHRQLRAMSEYIRRSLEEEARQRTVRWTFHVRRGTVADELLSACQSASVMSIGRAGRTRRALGATARTVVSKSMRPVLILGEAGRLTLPISVVCSQGADSERALQFASRLQRNRRGVLRVLKPSTIREQAEAELTQLIEEIARNSDTDIVVQTLGAGELRSIAAMEAGTLVRRPCSYAHLLSDRDGASIVIP